MVWGLIFRLLKLLFMSMLVIDTLIGTSAGAYRLIVLLLSNLSFFLLAFAYVESPARQ